MFIGTAYQTVFPTFASRVIEGSSDPSPAPVPRHRSWSNPVRTRIEFPTLSAAARPHAVLHLRPHPSNKYAFGFLASVLRLGRSHIRPGNQNLLVQHHTTSYNPKRCCNRSASDMYMHRLEFEFQVEGTIRPSGKHQS